MNILDAVLLRRADEQCATCALRGDSQDRDPWAIRPRRVAGPGRKGSLSDATVRRVRRLIAEGVPQCEVARMVGCSKGVIQGIREGRIYRSVA